MEKPIADVTASLPSYLSAPAYYFMELSGDGKHAVAFCTINSGGVKPRFIDPNTCDFRFTNLEVMYKFLSDYFGLYESKEMRGAKSWLLKFN